MAKAGWLGITIPEEYGGGGLGVTEAAIVEQEIAASGAGMNGCSAVHIGIFGFEPLIKYGAEQLEQRFLPRVTSGDLHISFAVTEPDAGTDTTNITTFAKKVDGGYVVTGKKVWITKALEAERMLLLCRTTPKAQVTKKTDGLTLLFAPMDREHVQIRPIPKMGRNAVDTNELFIDDLFVPDEDLVGARGQGLPTILSGSTRAGDRVQRIHRHRTSGHPSAVAYANDRSSSAADRANQAIAHPLAEALMRIDAADEMCKKAAWMIDHDIPCAREANMRTCRRMPLSAPRYRAADARRLRLRQGVHVERYFRESRLQRLAPISQEMVLNYLSEHVLGLPRSY